MIMTSEAPAALLEGVYVANVSPFLDDDRYSIDPHAYAAHVRWLADHGVTGIVPFGTNGEGPSIAVREKRSILEVLAAIEDLQIIATVAEANLPDTLDQLAFLDDLPVRAVMVMPPYYFKPVETEGLKIFLRAGAGSHPPPGCALSHPQVRHSDSGRSRDLPAGLGRQRLRRGSRLCQDAA
jgi:dihydrodipicolinate synthase/N-acetylneuraminate lyase